jgi:CubicO group peptidase (beta-lactamase class C family)
MTDIHGICAPEFSAVKDAFAENLASGMEIGCTVAITQGEEYAVDLWAGYKDEARTQPWEEDTVVMVASSTKIPTAIAGLMIVDQGLVHPDDPVAKHWPEFAQNGKENVLFRHLMTHTSGLPAPWPPIPFSTFFDWKATTEHLAAEEPWWEPGTAYGYHMNTFGFLIGEVVRRVTGQTPGVYLKEHVFDKIGADFRIGFPKSEFHRLSQLLPLDLAPDVEGLPVTPVHPDKIVGKWYARGEFMGQQSILYFELTADETGMHATFTRTTKDNVFSPNVEAVRFDGECLRVRAMTPGGTVSWDCHLVSPGVMDATVYAGGQEVMLTFQRDIEVKLEGQGGGSGNELATRMQQAVLPPEWRGSQSLTSEIPSGNGMGNARSLARIGAVMANGGKLAGHTFVSPETLEMALTEEVYQEGVTMNWGKVRFGLGFGLNSTEFPCPSDRSLHWGGAGGSVCVMDLESKTSFAYVMNGMLAGSRMDPRNMRLRAAYHKSLGVPWEDNTRS